MPGCEETPNEIRCRVKDPREYDDFRNKDVGGGVSFLIGRSKATGEWEVTAIRFDKANFTVESAQTWLTSHPDVGKRKSMWPPSEKRMMWKVGAPIMKVMGDLDSDHFYIFGDASVVLVDREGDKITAKALEHGLPQLLRRARLSLEHSDQLVGDIIDSATIDGETYETKVTDKGLKLLGDVWKDSRMCREVRRRILDGEYNSFSISGESLEEQVVCDAKGCWNNIDKLDLSAVAVCREGMNQGAKFTVLKSTAFELEVGDLDTQGGNDTTKDDKKEKASEGADKPKDENIAPPTSSKQEGETGATPPAAEQDEGTAVLESIGKLAEQVKSVSEALSTVSARIDALEQAKAQGEAPPKPPQEEEGKQATPPATPPTTEEEKAKALPDAGMNANPAPAPKKSKAQGAGGSQFKPEGGNAGRPAWEQIGEQVSKAGGLNRPGSPLVKNRKR
jgi:hypothetical protein